MWTYFKFEWRSFFTNRKNLAVYLLLLFLSVFYWLQIEGNFESFEKIKPVELQASVDTKTEFLKIVNREGEIAPETQFAIDFFPSVIENEESQLKALKEKDLHQLATKRSEWMWMSDPNPLYYKTENIYAEMETSYVISKKLVEFQEMGIGTEEITMDMLDDKTAVQAIIRSSKIALPILLMLTAVVFSMDIMLKDKKHASLIKGLPLSEGKRIIVKFFVVSLGMCVALVPLGIGFIGIGITQSFGSLKIPISVTYYVGKVSLFSDLRYDVIPASTFLLRVVILTSLFVLLLIIISILLSYWIKNAYFLMVVLLGLPLIELFYHRFGYGDIHRITYLPFSYVRVGEVVSGHRSFFFADPALTYQMGLLVMLISSAILFVLLAIVTRFKRSV